ncbi:hypothetical protein TSUD_239480 [Trifolium subterraneum]|uniref:F-box domain-containing protein n=1 Tax=Trifolium subterraneum TaxID=3900 RepID=A0A2Z6LPQ2_TRISU|nr:hypothetical protein TSUD_239480 [Trifolium subterraneum]
MPPPQHLLLLHQPDSASPVILPNELKAEIISWLPVKLLMKFRCLNKFFKTLISDPHFVQMHLKKSSRNLNLALMWQRNYGDTYFVSLSISRLLENHITIDPNPYHLLKENYHKWCMVGSCNGLIYLIDTHCIDHYYWLCFWNPATRTRSKRISTSLRNDFKFAFGYDNSTETYKTVAFRVDLEGGNAKSEVKVFTLGNKYPIDIQCFPVIPLYWFHRGKNNGVYLSGTINWLALSNYFFSNYDFGNHSMITVEQYVIVSLDLSTESYSQLLLPRGFDKVPCVQPMIVVLMDSVCFGHDFKRTHFVIWQMKDFGVQESWIQLFKISYQNIHSSDHLLKFKRMQFLPLYLSENMDTLILANDENDIAFIYNCKDGRVERIRIPDKIWWFLAKDYVESLVATR